MNSRYGVKDSKSVDDTRGFIYPADYVILSA